MSLSSPSTFLCVAGGCTIVDKNAHTIGARHSFSAFYHNIEGNMLFAIAGDRQNGDRENISGQCPVFLTNLEGKVGR